MRYVYCMIPLLMAACHPQSQTQTRQQPVALATLSGYLDEKENIWVSADAHYIPDEFSGNAGAYATVSHVDESGNSKGIGLINRRGEIVVPIVYEGIDMGFNDGVCQVVKGDLRGLVDTTGREIVPPSYEYIAQYAEDGLLRVGKNDRYGMMNLKGDIVIPLEYQDAQAAGDGMVAVMAVPQRWGYVNLKNEIVFQPEFTAPGRFENGQASVQKTDGENYTIYKNGKIEKQ
ncbi:WG repeat-containing protein [Chitinophaga lutea]|nr:WG repeat-containing protein [Chitinophaga lutea]